MSTESNWARIVRWCEHHAPTTAARMRTSAGPQAVRDAETATGRSWPEQLRQWFALHDGSCTDRPVALVIPGFVPVSVADAVEIHERMVRLWQGTTDDLGGAAALTALPAGSEVCTYLPAHIPIGDDGAGDYLVVDTRGGDRAGCVVRFCPEGGENVQWDSLDVMLDAVATTLEQGSDCAGWVPFVDNGVLDWDLP